MTNDCEICQTNGCRNGFRNDHITYRCSSENQDLKNLIWKPTATWKGLLQETNTGPFLQRCPHIEIGSYQMVSILVFTSETHHAGHLAPPRTPRPFWNQFHMLLLWRVGAIRLYRSDLVVLVVYSMQEERWESWESCKSRDINRNLPINPLIKVLAAETPGKPQRKSPAGIHVLVLQIAAVDSKPPIVYTTNLQAINGSMRVCDFMGSLCSFEKVAKWC